MAPIAPKPATDRRDGPASGTRRHLHRGAAERPRALPVDPHKALPSAAGRPRESIPRSTGSY
jgi:hypothetical protein